MFKRLLFLITFTCGVLIAFSISASSLQSYQASESLGPNNTLQDLNLAQSDNNLGQIRECNRGCSWLPSPLRFFCDYVEIPEFDNGGNPSCYRRDWDIDGDGVMEGPPENNA